MPLNDKFMCYDKYFHRYKLTMQGASSVADISKIYASTEDAERVLNTISRRIYTYIYTIANSANRDYIEYRLAFDDSLRRVILEAMLAQLEADIASGQLDIVNQGGINFQYGHVIDEREIAKRSICVEAKKILANSNGRFNILFMGDYGIRLPDDRYIRWDY